MAIFGPKPRVKPFGKMSIFRLFELLFFYSLQKRFFDLEDSKTHFPGLYCQKKKVEKIANWDPNHGLTLWKILILRLFVLVVFIA